MVFFGASYLLHTHHIAWPRLSHLLANYTNNVFEVTSQRSSLLPDALQRQSYECSQPLPFADSSEPVFVDMSGCLHCEFSGIPVHHEFPVSSTESNNGEVPDRLTWSSVQTVDFRSSSSQVFCQYHHIGCPVPDVSIYYMSNINELPDGILFHWFCKCTPPWMFLPLDIPSEYRPEHVTFGLLCVIFKFLSRIFCRRVPGFATDCACGVWCRGLTTCLLYVGPPLEF